MSQDDSLTSWVQARLTDAYEFAPDTETENMASSFDNMLSPKAEITVNGASVPYDQFRKDLTERKGMVNRAKVEWKDVIEVPDEENKHAGLVAGTFVVTRQSKLRIRAGPATHHNTVVFHAKVAEEEGAGEEGRRIVQLALASATKAAPINLARPH
ncbi:hypothetical protein BD626DRAFT_423221 [Schizophyllum amplum]|uniref:Uncharacterized protein n=1 Tax=Schizophyllum amplum TaxID=97359 RepID=A0A550D038_9AGAR|nr:hypothetical protein BD626DRAFT_423221 [Auriculariopsis ampla]